MGLKEVSSAKVQHAGMCVSLAGLGRFSPYRLDRLGLGTVKTIICLYVLYAHSAYANIDFFLLWLDGWPEQTTGQPLNRSCSKNS